MNWARASGTSTCRNALDGRPAEPPSTTSHSPPPNHDASSDTDHAQAVGSASSPLPCRPSGVPAIDHGASAGEGLHPIEVIWLSAASKSTRRVRPTPLCTPKRSA
jgi:hypothetical protein